MDAEEARAKLGEHLIESCRFEFSDYAQWWRDLDAKAQGTVSLGGVILGGLAVFVTASDYSFTFLQAVSLLIVTISLLLSVGFAIFSLLVRETDVPPTGETIEELALEVLNQKPEELVERYCGVLFEQTEDWKTAIESLYDQCSIKSERLRWSQIFILIAVIFICASALLGIDKKVDGIRGVDAYEVQCNGLRERSGVPEKSMQEASGEQEKSTKEN